MLRGLVSMLLLTVGLAMLRLWFGVQSSPTSVSATVTEMTAAKSLPLFHENDDLPRAQLVRHGSHGREIDLQVPAGALERPDLPLPSVTRQAGREPQTRRELIVEIQTSLERANCLHGHVSGSWDATTRRAALTFLQVVNARLPTNRADYVLLRLLQTHRADKCVKRADQLAKWARMPDVSGSKTGPPISNSVSALNSLVPTAASGERSRISSSPIASRPPHPVSAGAESGIE